MDKCPTSCCQMKRDLDDADDVFAFLADYCPLSNVLNELDELSQQELRCAVCLYGSALLRISHKRSFWKRLKSKYLYK